MSQEQFDLEWNAISNLNMEGATFEEAVEYFSVPNSNAASFSFAQENEFNQPLVVDDNNYAEAA